ncbi:MAG TPA: hypothetical protein VFF63_00845 [Candidatus Babeliales bacterium]|nr:hypothetical protein [Candidatus Babeliales bacterium]
MRPAVSGASSKTYKCSSGPACVWGESSGTQTAGVRGDSDATGAEQAGVEGFSFSALGTGYGVLGESNNGAGVYGQTNTPNTSDTAAGVYGVSSDAPGVSGVSANASGVYGSSDSGDGLSGTSKSGTGLYAYSTSGSGATIYNDSSEYVALFVEAEDNDLPASFCGTKGCEGIEPGGEAVKSLGPRNSAELSSYAVQASRAQIEDVGSGKIVDGRGYVSFDGSLRRAMDMRQSYYVFLTPGGDNRGLYVASKTADGFEVREAQGGRSSVGFDYRVVGIQIGESGARFPRFPSQASRAKQLTHPHTPKSP